MFLLIYLLIGVLCLGIAAYLNFTHKWITKTDVSYDAGLTAFLIFISTVFWPVSLIVFGVMLLWKYLTENAFPDDD